MSRKCSGCGKTGHNSRTCSGFRSIATVAGPRLLGVHLGFSVDFLPASDGNSTYGGGYASDGLFGGCRSKKKGVPWTEDEHRMFLFGLEKLRKGDWRGISRNYVATRTASQVASHAQKYFLRLASFNNKKQRSSLFDAVETKDKIRAGLLKLRISRLQQFFPPVSIPEQSLGEEDHVIGIPVPNLDLGLSISRPAEKTQKPPVPRQTIVT